MLFSDRYLFRTRITFLTDYDISDRSSVDSTDSSGNHHIKAMFSGFYFLGSLHFTYIGSTPATQVIYYKLSNLLLRNDARTRKETKKKSPGRKRQNIHLETSCCCVLDAHVTVILSFSYSSCFVGYKHTIGANTQKLSALITFNQYRSIISHCALFPITKSQFQLAPFGDGFHLTYLTKLVLAIITTFTFDSQKYHFSFSLVYLIHERHLKMEKRKKGKWEKRKTENGKRKNGTHTRDCLLKLTPEVY